jgi:hypothetical protein
VAVIFPSARFEGAESGIDRMSNHLKGEDSQGSFAAHSGSNTTDLMLFYRGFGHFTIETSFLSGNAGIFLCIYVLTLRFAES